MAHAKKTKLHVGLVAIPVRLEVAVDSESSDVKVVCTGPEEAKHEPSRVSGSMTCSVCKTKHSSHWGFPERGVERDGKMVLLTEEEIAEAKGEPIKELHLGLHDRAEVYGLTVSGDSVQNVYPDKGGEKAYTALLTALTEHPNLVAASVFAPSTKNALWVLEVVDGRIVASKRAWPEDVRTPQAIPTAEVPDVEQKMMNMVVEQTVTPFTMDSYQDAARRGVAALIESRLGSAVATAAGAPTEVSSTDMMSALQATLDAAKKTAPKVVAGKKAAPKKRTAKKTASARKSA